MLPKNTKAKHTAILPLLLFALFCSGCSILQPAEPPPVETQTPLPEPEPEPIVIVEPPEPLPAPIRPATPEPAELPSVSIVLTSQLPAYADVALELAARFEAHDIYDLSDRSQPPVTALRLINDSSAGAVIAIGLRAAQSAVAMADAPVIFSQVFNYQEHDLLHANVRGVAPLAPLSAQIAAWKQLDPSLQRIGMIVGEGHEDLITEAELAAEQHGIELDVQMSRSDQETIYFFKRMVRKIDGYWLLPDNRILSPRALQQVLHEADRRNVPIAVPNEAMLDMGASISLSTVAGDIADTIVKIVRMIQADKLDRVPAVSPLSEVRVATNDAVLEKTAVARSGAGQGTEAQQQ